MFKFPEEFPEQIESMNPAQQEQSESNNQDLNLITAQELLSQVRMNRSLETEQEKSQTVHRTWTIDPAFTEWLKSLPPGGKLSIRDK